MSINVLTKIYEAPLLCKSEILRYAGVKSTDMQTEALLQTCLSEAESILSYKLCYAELPVRVEADICDFGIFKVSSHSLSARLCGCKSAVIFLATVGAELDRLIIRYSRLSPSKALMLGAIGDERVEALCDAFCKELAASGCSAVNRFSPGYGDLPLSMQSDIFALLEPQRRVGAFLNESLLISPSKTVTAIVGIKEI